jgi:hypothetical protein
MLCQYSDKDILYKLTDLGHVSQISLCSIDEDGDCRYLALEAIQKCNTKKINLDKCDIYSLGLTLYVCGTNSNLPKQGNEWQQLRLNISQYLHSFTQCTKQFNDLILQRMCNIDPNQRPSAYEVNLLKIIIVNKTFLFFRFYSILLSIHRYRQVGNLSGRFYCFKKSSNFLFYRHNLKQEREKNVTLNKKLLDHYLLTNSSDINDNIQFQQGFLSPTQSTSNDNSRLLSINSPNIDQSAISPTHCGSFAIKQQVKLAGSNMHRFYSSII